MTFTSNAIPQLTIEVWLKRDTAISSYGGGRTETIAQFPKFGGPAQDVLNISLIDDSVVATYGQNVKVSCLYPADTEWHHIAFVSDTVTHILSFVPTIFDTAFLYLDGVKMSHGVGNRAPLMGAGAGSTINIGYSHFSSGSDGNYYSGNLTMLAVYDTALYANNFTPSCVFDTVRFFRNDSLLMPCDYMAPLNGNDTGYYSLNQVKVNNAVVSELSSPCDTVVTTTSIGTIQKDLISIYPNPGHGTMSISSDLLLEKIEVINLLGQTVLSEKTTGNTMQIDLSALQNGIYLLRVNEGIIYKIIKD
ncbi:hypothetical protein CJD36_015545 [Flavipsychrobacter stenotrophus]|uniref:Secretion system C-terminal sorting domain-containing protein n=1 Tax=Flavipsychrobacter stenotrophus TaxID=2077091 RepID=A0A2S7ST45_9BACT|nr:T9SS type A sorting domain-containing protein [Flavipsychrobacter stenotrophus]PQJ10109.1 hypothetical protein CJD36_015545 [Flavipsychrobacter stenotrophus]